MTKQTFQSLIALLFILSGATGLVYQIVWFKYLSLFLGNTTYAQTIVLATFMGGLAIGAALWGRRADNIHKPVMLYAILELGIAAYCFFFPNILGVVKSVFFDVVISLNMEVGSASLLFLKLIVSALMLLVPTILMGGTLPVLVKGITNRIEESGRSVAILYFLNSFGAVIGSLMGGFILIRLVGLEATIGSTAILNAAIGFIALFLSLQNYELKDDPTSPSSVQSAKPQSFTKKEIVIAILIAGISGLASMIYEVTWVRMLTPVFGSSTYSFSLMLVAFISGITLGSWIVSKQIGTMKNTFGFLATCQFGVVIAMLMSLPIYSRIPYLFWKASTILTKSDTTYPLYLAFQFAFCFFIMFIPTIFLGMSLPVASHIASRSIEKLGRTIGNVFSINTVGTVIGSLAAGLLLVPLFGIQRTVEIAIGINVLAGVIILFADSVRTMAKKVVIVSTVLVLSVGYSLFASDWSQLMFYSGVFRMLVKQDIQAPKTFEEFVFRTNQKTDLYYKEGTTATVAVVNAVAAGKQQNVLIINGKADASSVGDLPTQILLAQLPMLLHSRPDTALIIGYGSGVTAGSILTHDIKSVDCVEISPEVMEASKHFEHVNGKPLSDPRFTLHLEDAHAFLSMTPKQYDVIISEPSNPWIAGIGNLYSVDFFKKCKEKLRIDGLMVQWFHLYEIDDEIFKLVLRTFQKEFPFTTVWHSLRNDVLLVGAQHPIQFSMESLRRKVLNEKVSKDLARVDLNHIPSILSLQSLSSKQAKDYAGTGILNTEDKPYLEYTAPRALFASKGVNEYRFYDERSNIVSEDLFLSIYNRRFPLSSGDAYKIAVVNADAERGDQNMAYSLLKELHAQFPKDQDILVRLGALAGQLGRIEESREYLAQLSKMRPNDPIILSQYAWLKFSSERPVSSYLSSTSMDECEQLMLKAIALTKDTVDTYHIRLGDMFFAFQQFQKAADHYWRALEIRQQFDYIENEHIADLLMKLSKACYFGGDLKKALEFAAHASVQNPASEEIKDYMYKIAMRQLEE
ncbi:MAG: fused MFS/spermidine synthase [Bacteroidota bacterium]